MSKGKADQSILNDTKGTSMILPNPAPWFGVDTKSPKYYKGLRMKTDTNLHEQLLGLIEQLIKNTSLNSHKPKFLDWGCGEGALSQRLYDMGYEVVSVDMDKESFMAQGPKFYKIDFNQEAEVACFIKKFAGVFDIVLAVEVIEHVQNPWDFIRKIKALCHERTQVIITTPNISSWWGRFWFFLTGDLWGYSKESWVDPGHINPLTEVEMRGILNENGFEYLQVLPVGNLPIIWAYNWKRLLISIFVLPLYFVMKGQKNGWVLCFHVRLKS